MRHGGESCSDFSDHVKYTVSYKCTGVSSNQKVDQKAQFQLAAVQAQGYQADSPAQQAV
jgi:hypothetical protein